MDELHRVDDWLTALLANLEPTERQRMMRELAQELRRNQQNNIRLQRNPDGSGYEPRKVTARTKKGRAKVWSSALWTIMDTNAAGAQDGSAPSGNSCGTG